MPMRTAGVALAGEDNSTSSPGKPPPSRKAAKDGSNVRHIGSFERAGRWVETQQDVELVSRMRRAWITIADEVHDRAQIILSAAGDNVVGDLNMWDEVLRALTPVAYTASVTTEGMTLVDTEDEDGRPLTLSLRRRVDHNRWQQEEIPATEVTLRWSRGPREWKGRTTVKVPARTRYTHAACPARVVPDESRGSVSIRDVNNPRGVTWVGYTHAENPEAWANARDQAKHKWEARERARRRAGKSEESWFWQMGQMTYRRPPSSEWFCHHPSGKSCLFDDDEPWPIGVFTDAEDSERAVAYANERKLQAYEDTPEDERFEYELVTDRNYIDRDRQEVIKKPSALLLKKFAAIDEDLRRHLEEDIPWSYPFDYEGGEAQDSPATPAEDANPQQADTSARTESDRVSRSQIVHDSMSVMSKTDRHTIYLALGEGVVDYDDLYAVLVEHRWEKDEWLATLSSSLSEGGAEFPSYYHAQYVAPTSEEQGDAVVADDRGETDTIEPEVFARSGGLEAANDPDLGGEQAGKEGEYIERGSEADPLQSLVIDVYGDPEGALETIRQVREHLHGTMEELNIASATANAILRLRKEGVDWYVHPDGEARQDLSVAGALSYEGPMSIHSTVRESIRRGMQSLREAEEKAVMYRHRRIEEMQQRVRRVELQRVEDLKLEIKARLLTSSQSDKYEQKLIRRRVLNNVQALKPGRAKARRGMLALRLRMFMHGYDKALDHFKRPPPSLWRRIAHRIDDALFSAPRLKRGWMMWYRESKKRGLIDIEKSGFIRMMDAVRDRGVVARTLPRPQVGHKMTRAERLYPEAFEPRVVRSPVKLETPAIMVAEMPFEHLLSHEELSRRAAEEHAEAARIRSMNAHRITQPHLRRLFADRNEMLVGNLPPIQVGEAMGALLPFIDRATELEAGPEGAGVIYTPPGYRRL